ncbi:NAD(+) diphosphatase [Nonomuraea dietziae]|uniref:NAD(+) diphosphatase n=1 Tax=Nonomuraea dietziae TaxID=65515 RepID=UPI0036071E50
MLFRGGKCAWRRRRKSNSWGPCSSREERSTDRPCCAATPDGSPAHGRTPPAGSCSSTRDARWSGAQANRSTRSSPPRPTPPRASASCSASRTTSPTSRSPRPCPASPTPTSTAGSSRRSACATPEGEPFPAGLREVGALLGDRDAGLLVYAVALEAWHTTHEYCPRCGSRTRVEAGGHIRVCPEDNSQHFPRVDPAVIMLVRDERDRCLLARGPQWPEGRLSILAGFVEPGESLEHAVIREVAEEVGVNVINPRYLGSQPWPFPRSLMLGFFAEATSTEITCDLAEIAEARWFTRAELLAALRSGEVRLPPPVSIARRLIETWYGDHLTGDW